MFIYEDKLSIEYKHFRRWCNKTNNAFKRKGDIRETPISKFKTIFRNPVGVLL